MQNISRALELLQIPEETGSFNGQIATMYKHQLVETELVDFTKMVVNPATGKKEPTKTSTFSSEFATSSFGAYSLNMISNYIHGFDYNVVGEMNGSYVLSKPYMEFERDGKTYWIGWGRLDLVPITLQDGTTGTDFVVTNEQGMNTTMSGPVAHDINVMTVTVYKKTFVKTSSTTPTTFTKSYPKYTVAKLMERAKMNESQLANAFRTIYRSYTRNPINYCTSLATDIVITDGKLKGEVYINGILSKDIPFTSLTASYGKKLPDFVVRWKLYHPSIQQGTYGAAWNTQMTSREDNTISIVKGDKIEYNTDTKTLTYLEGSKMVFDFEFLPAQGKNETWGTVLDLDTMIKTVYA
jgi:hypothetical protein